MEKSPIKSAGNGFGFDLRPCLDEKRAMNRISEAPLFDHSLAYFVGAISVMFFALVVFAIPHADIDSVIGFHDEVKVEAAQFPFPPAHDMDIFAAGCNGKVAKTPCKTR